MPQEQMYSIEITLDNAKFELRVKLNGGIVTFEAFKNVIDGKLKRLFAKKGFESQNIETIHYTLPNSTGFYEIYGDEDVVDFNDEKLVTKIIINGELNKRIQNESTSKLDKSYEAAMAKLTISNFPYQFNGNSNLNHFKLKVNNYCKINDIGDDVLIKLIFTGKVIIGDAFKYIENKIYSVYAKAEAEKLEIIWYLLQNKYGKSNHVITCKQRLQNLSQNKLINKKYLDKFIEFKDELDLEIDLEKEKGFVCEPFGEYETTEIFMKGLRDELQSNIARDIMQKYKTTSITMNELEEILRAEIEREKYLNLIQNKSVLNKIDNANLDATNLKQVTDGNMAEMNALKKEISALKLELSKSRRQCRHGMKCRHGLDCKFEHAEGEINHFRSRESMASNDSQEN